MKGFATIPVEYLEYGVEKPGWYYWDETWSEPIGPFEDEITAYFELGKYCERLDKEYNEI